MHNWSHTVLEAIQQEAPPVLVSLISEGGSVPRTAGARMLVLPDGSIKGTIGGGKYEAIAIEEAQKMLHAWHASPQKHTTALPLARMMHFSLQGVRDMDMVCGGELVLLLELLSQTTSAPEVFCAAAKAQQRHGSFIFITHLTAAGPPTGEEAAQKPSHIPMKGVRHMYCCDSKTLVGPETIPDLVLNEAIALKEIIPQQIATPVGMYLLESFPSPPVLHVFGGGHVAKALVSIAHTLNFRIIVLEDRPEFITAERFPHVETRLLPVLGQKEAATYFAEAHMTKQHGIVIMTRGHTHDREVLAAALQEPAGYVGMIGSRRKWQQIRKNLLLAGIPPEQLNRVCTPIGIDIGADTPEEIAVSIAAELIAWQRKKQTA